MDDDAVVLPAGRIGAGGGGRVVMRVVRFTPPLTIGPSLSGLTLLNELVVFLIHPSIAILLRSVIGILLGFAARKLDMDIFRRAGKVEAWRPIHFLAVEIIDDYVAQDHFPQLAGLGKDIHQTCINQLMFEIARILCKYRLN